jgi:hypothetical protein
MATCDKEQAAYDAAKEAFLTEGDECVGLTGQELAQCIRRARAAAQVDLYAARRALQLCLGGPPDGLTSNLSVEGVEVHPSDPSLSFSWSGREPSDSADLCSRPNPSQLFHMRGGSGNEHARI